MEKRCQCIELAHGFPSMKALLKKLVAKPMYRGLKSTLQFINTNLFPMISGVIEWCKQTGEERSKWPRTLRVDFIAILPYVRWLRNRCYLLSHV